MNHAIYHSVIVSFYLLFCHCFILSLCCSIYCSIIVSFYHCIILSIVLSYYRSLYDSVIVSFYLSFYHSNVVSFCRIVIYHYFILSVYQSIILSFCHSIVVAFYLTFYLLFYRCTVLSIVLSVSRLFSKFNMQHTHQESKRFTTYSLSLSHPPLFFFLSSPFLFSSHLRQLISDANCC